MASEWIETTLGEICLSQGGAINTGPFGSQLHASDYSEVGTPVVMPINLVGGRVSENGIARVSNEHVSRLARHCLSPGDIVFSRRGDVTRFALVSERERGWLCGTGCLKISLGAATLTTPEFISAYLSSPDTKEWLVRHAVGATMPNLNTEILSDVPITLPPLSNQVLIGVFLAEIGHRIDLLRQTNATLEAIAQALFKSWFVDFDPVRAKMEGREPDGMDAGTAALFPSELEESELGLVPKGWSIRAVGDVATIIRGRSYKSSELAESDTALVTLKSFNRGGGFRRDGFKPYTGAFKPEQEVFEGDCIVAYTDVTQQAELIGRSAVVTRSPIHSRLVASLDVGIVRPKTEVSTSIFLSALLSGERYLNYIKGYTSGTTVLHLSKDGLPGFTFACPSPGLVSAYSELASAVFRRQATNIAVQESLAELRDTLLPRLVCGKLRLPEAEEAGVDALA